MNSEQLKQLENNLWAAADNLRANTDLKSSECSPPVLRLTFLKFVDNKYSCAQEAITRDFTKLQGTRCAKPISENGFQKSDFYLLDNERNDYLSSLSEDKGVAKAIKCAMLSSGRTLENGRNKQ